MRYRWVVLAVGTFAQASYAALLTGLSVIAPALRDHFRLSLAQTGVILACTNVGSMISLIPWGLLADRIRERVVIGAGLGTAACAVGAAAFVHGFWALAALLVLGGLGGAGVNAGSGRAVLAWFPPARRGAALGIRQTAIPIAGFATAIVLPHLSVPGAFLVLACWLGAAAVIAAAVVREGPAPAPEELKTELAGGPLRDRRMWRLALGSSLLVSVQMGVVGFAVLFLHEDRHVTEGAAGLVVAAMAVLGGVLRVASGHWSDVLGERLPPIRRLSLALAAAVLATTALLSAPLAVLVPVLVVAGGLAMSWNGLSFTAAAETAGRARTGAAIGFQQTALAVSSALAAPAFAGIVAASSWRLAFGLLGLAPLLAWRVFVPLRG